FLILPILFFGSPHKTGAKGRKVTELFFCLRSSPEEEEQRERVLAIDKRIGRFGSEGLKRSGVF
ncbi:hypothetical protein V2J09_014408, partial [Rumex salicifolius]